MRPVMTIIAFAIACSACRDSAADETLQPLDTRTRCVVLFRECVVHIANKDIDAILLSIADGHGENQYILRTDRNSVSPDLKKELGDVDEFLKHNFRHSGTIKRRINDILFSTLSTAKEPVTITNEATKTEFQGKLHTIKITIPEVDDGRFSELRFVDVAGDIYWVPFGW